MRRENLIKKSKQISKGLKNEVNRYKRSFKKLKKTLDILLYNVKLESLMKMKYFCRYKQSQKQLDI